MDSVRCRAATTRNIKSSGYVTTVANSTVPSAGDGDSHHQGRRHRSRRRDGFVAADDVVRVSALSSAAATDTPGCRVDSTDVRSPSSTPFWIKSTSAGSSGTVARFRHRPQFLHDGGIQRSELPEEYRCDTLYGIRNRDQQLMVEGRRCRRQQEHHHTAGLHPTVEYAARCIVDCHPQTTSTSHLGRTVTSPTSASLSPPYSTDNKTLLKEVIISAAAAKLARSSSARSAVVRPLVVVRNGPPKSSSDEHVDVDDDEDDPTITHKSPVSVDEPSSPTVAVSVATAMSAAVSVEADDAAITAAAAAATTRRTRRVRRRDAVDEGESSLTASSTSRTGEQHTTGTRSSRLVGHSDSQSAGAETWRSWDHVGDNLHAAAVSHLSGTAAGDATGVTQSLSRVKNNVISGDDETDSRSDSLRSEPRRRENTTMNCSTKNEREATVALETRRASPSSTSKVSFIKTILSRTRSPSPSRRLHRGKSFHTSPSPSSVKRLGAEVAQRIGEPFKGYLKHLRDRSSQRRRPTQTTLSNAVDTSSKPGACQGREVAAVESQSTLSGTCPAAGPVASCDDRCSDNTSADRTTSRAGRQFQADRKKTESGASTPLSQWKSTSELTTPMGRLDNLLKAVSLQHLQTTTTTVSHDIRPSVPPISGTATSASLSSRPPLLQSKTSKSTGCLLSSSSNEPFVSGEQEPSVDGDARTSMSRCYLEKPPRAARRALTVELDRRAVVHQTLSLVQSTNGQTEPSTESVPDPEASGSSRGTDHVTTSPFAGELTTTAAVAMDQTSSASRQRPVLDGELSLSIERNILDLYEQKRLERQLEEKLALIEKERADLIAKLCSQFDNRCEANVTVPRQTTANISPVNDHTRDTSTSTGLVLPLCTPPPPECNSEMTGGDPLGELLNELSRTPTTTRWSERRRAGRVRGSVSSMRPRAASCSRPQASQTPAAAAAALTSKSQSHSHLHRNSSNASDLVQDDSSCTAVQLRHRSHQQQASLRPLTCYLPVRDRNFDLRRFVETAGHRLDQCEHVQLTASTCHGYLSKLSSSAAVRQWKRRWFVFDRTRRCLHYYADKTENRADGAAVWFQTIQDVFVDHERRSRSSRPDSTFCVKTVERSLFLMAATPETMRIWIDVIFTGAEGYQQFLEEK